MPLTAVLVLGANAGDMGWLTAAPLVPSLVLSIPVGSWVDGRRSRRRIMLWADLGRFATVASIPAAYALGVLTFAQLFVTAFLLGILSVLFNVSNNTLFVSIVTNEDLVQGSVLVNGSRSAASVVGPGVGGVLVQLCSAPTVLADAFSYVASVLCLSRISPSEPPPEPVGKGRALDGMRWVIRTPTMRAIQGAVATLNFFNYAFQALFVLYVTKDLGLRPSALGLILGAGAVGGLAAVLLASRVVRRFGIGLAIAFGFVGFSVPRLLVPLAAGPAALVTAVLLVATFLANAGAMVLDTSANAYMMAIIPAKMRARVSGVLQTVNFGIRPLGAVTGGLLGSTLGLHTTLWIATGGAACSAIWLWTSPLPGIRDIPTTTPETVSV